MRRWGPVLAAILGIALLGGIVTAVAAVTDWDGPNRNHDNEITRVVGANGEETIIVHDNDRGFFFPGILFIPLFFLLFFGLARALFGRGSGPGSWSCGPRSRRPGGPDAGHVPPWFDEWHRRVHGGDANDLRDAPLMAAETPEATRG